ncbi:MAG: hypothetical protein V4489_10305 [Chlamydiota bacterium]
MSSMLKTISKATLPLAFMSLTQEKNTNSTQNISSLGYNRLIAPTSPTKSIIPNKFTAYCDSAKAPEVEVARDFSTPKYNFGNGLREIGAVFLSYMGYYPYALDTPKSMKPKVDIEDALESNANTLQKLGLYTDSLDRLKSMNPGARKENALENFTKEGFGVEVDYYYCRVALEALEAMEPGAKKEDALENFANRLLEHKSIYPLKRKRYVLASLKAMEPGARKEDTLENFANKSEMSWNYPRLSKPGEPYTEENRANALGELLKHYEVSVDILKMMEPGEKKENALKNRAIHLMKEMHSKNLSSESDLASINAMEPRVFENMGPETCKSTARCI